MGRGPGQGQARLAHAARADEADQAGGRVGKEAGQFGQFEFAAEEGRGGGGQVLCKDVPAERLHGRRQALAAHVLDQGQRGRFGRLAHLLGQEVGELLVLAQGAGPLAGQGQGAQPLAVGGFVERVGGQAAVGKRQGAIGVAAAEVPTGQAVADDVEGGPQPLPGDGLPLVEGRAVGQAEAGQEVGGVEGLGFLQPGRRHSAHSSSGGVAVGLGGGDMGLEGVHVDPQAAVGQGGAVQAGVGAVGGDEVVAQRPAQQRQLAAQVVVGVVGGKVGPEQSGQGVAGLDAAASVNGRAQVGQQGATAGAGQRRRWRPRTSPQSWWAEEQNPDRHGQHYSTRQKQNGTLIPLMKTLITLLEWVNSGISAKSASSAYHSSASNANGSLGRRAGDGGGMVAW